MANGLTFFRAANMNFVRLFFAERGYSLTIENYIVVRTYSGEIAQR